MCVATGLTGYMFYVFCLISIQGYAHLVERNPIILGTELVLTFFCFLYLLFKTFHIFYKKGSEIGTQIKNLI